MIRIICAKCKNAYLKKEDENLVCPSCKEVFPESMENLLLGAQYYTEGKIAEAGDCLMKYIVKNGAEPQAMFYKALCDASLFDEDTVSLNDLYEKLLQSLSEFPDDLFIRYLAIANDEAERIEKLISENHIRQFENADAEKIKKEVTVIIGFQNEAKEFRAKLTDLTNAYNERATKKIGVRFSTCHLVQPEVATEVGALKFDKVKESIESHTVFTGILSTDIKNLEIYYRCIVMFFEKDRQKYDFLMESAEKFNDLAKLLEEGRYSSISGVPTIANKLKSAAYDFFQESLKDHDDEFEQQTETVVVIVPETVEVPVEETEVSDETVEDNTVYEDIYSDSTSTEEIESEESTPVSEEMAEEAEVLENTSEDAVFELPVADNFDEITPVSEIKETENLTEKETETVETVVEEEISEKDETNEAVFEIAEEAEETEESEESEEISEQTAEFAEESSEVIEVSDETETDTADVQKSDDSEEKESEYEKVEVTDEAKVVIKHKKNYAPFVAIILVILAIAGLIALKVVPDKLNAANYEKASVLATEKKYAEAAEVFAELGDYSDAQDKAVECRYNHACSLETEKKYTEAKAIFSSLGNYEDSVAKTNSCAYNEALAVLEAGNFDEAATLFEQLKDYADSATMIKECSYKKALALLGNKDYEGAIEIFTNLDGYSDSADKILEAKYGYAKDNLDAKNETTLSYLKDLAQAKYKDSADLRNKLLGISNELAAGVTSCINYNPTDTQTALTEADKSKVIYFHVVVTEPELYNKKLTIDYTTSMGYHDTKGIVLTADDNTYTFAYPSTNSSNYSVVFKLLSDDNTTLTTQQILIK